MSDIKLSTADTAGFIPQFWANRALEVLRSNIVLTNVVARDTDFTDAGWSGKTITIPYPGIFTAVKKSADTPVTPQVPSGGNSVPLTLSNHECIPMLVEDFANAQANSELMDRYIEPGVVALAEQVEGDIWLASMTAGTIAPIGTPGTDLTASVARSAMVKLNQAKAPQKMRSFVVSPKDQGALLGDSALSTYFAFSQADAVRNGEFGRMYGFDVFMSQLAPSGYTATVAATGGTFTLSYGGQTTTALAWNATPAAVQTALQALSSVGSGLASVSGIASTGSPATGGYNIVFASSTTGTLTADSTSLTGGTHTATVTAAQKNLALHRNAVVFAVRPFRPVPPQAGVYMAVANDPDSGLSLRLAAQYDINNMGMRLNIDILYGTASLRANQAVIVDA